MRLYESGRRDGTFDAGSPVRAARHPCQRRSSCFAGSATRNRPGGRARVHRVSDLELASRLSFFLWSSIPDDELLTVASQGRLKDPAVLDQQVRRMLADPKSQALVDNFAGQWLYLRNLKSTQPDQNEFPDFDDNLRQAFQRETELFFESVIREDRSVARPAERRLHVRQRAAGPALRHPEHLRQPVPARRRRPTTRARDCSGKGSILLVTSHAGRTSPVVRGKWILDNLLGTPPPPPPPDVPALEEKSATSQPHSVRERLEQHRANPSCASCHKLMDPLGLALENFDAVGAWRTRDAGSPIDASGSSSMARAVDGVVALRQAILRQPGHVRADAHREAADVRARPRAQPPRHAGRARHRPRRGRATIIGFRR